MVEKLMREMEAKINALRAENVTLKECLKQQELNNHEFAEFASKTLNRFKAENAKLKDIIGKEKSDA